MDIDKTKLRLIKLSSGELIIGEVDTPLESKKTEIQIKNPRALLHSSVMTGSTSVMLTPVCFPFNSKRLLESMTISTSIIVFQLFGKLNELDDEVVAEYMQLFNENKTTSNMPTFN